MQIPGCEEVQPKPRRGEDQHIHMLISDLGNKKRNHSDGMNEIPALENRGEVTPSVERNTEDVNRAAIPVPSPATLPGCAFKQESAGWGG